MKTSAFTLIELVVVIAVTMIIMGLAVPALMGARKSASVTVCLSNIRNAGVLLTLYNGSSEDAYPYAGPTAHTITIPGVWNATVGGTQGLSQSSWLSYFHPEAWSGVRIKRAYLCPDQPEYDPAIPGAAAPPFEPRAYQGSYYWLHAPFWSTPQDMVAGSKDTDWRPRQIAVSDVRFPSSKSLLHEFNAFCSINPRAVSAIYAYSNMYADLGSEAYRSSVLMVDLSAQRLAQREGIPGVSGHDAFAFMNTRQGVWGRDR